MSAERDSFRDLVRARTGIHLDAGKDYLIQSRLGPIAGTLGFSDVEALLQFLRQAPRGAAADAAIDAMTTNETYFFRDDAPFEHLRRLLVDRGRKAGLIRVWSAACSTGQEPYSVAMLWEELAHLLPGARLEIVASDYSEACLAKARAGLYSAFEVQRGLPIQKLIKHFEREGEAWRAKPHLRQAVTWSRHNLLDSPRAMGGFDIILCRNVMIYFEADNRRRVLDHLSGQLRPDGRLILGAAETIAPNDPRFAASAGQPGLYELKSDLRQSSRMAV